MRFTLAILCACGLAVSAYARQPRAAPFVPVGVTLDAERGAAASDADLAGLRMAGFNAITLQVDWKSVETTQGRDDLDAVERLLTRAGNAGLRVVVRLDTDRAPDWVAKRFPDGRLISARGTPVVSNGIPQLCFDHDGVRAAVESFISAVVARSAAQRSVYAFDFDGAAGSPGPPVCYCVNTTARFRTWLQQMYGTVASLNAAWSRDFTGWDEVAAPGGVTATGGRAQHDWQALNTTRVQEQL